MKKILRIYFQRQTLILLICILFANHVNGSERLVVLSSVKSRSMALGGSFISISDHLPALDMNPAGFKPSLIGENKSWQVYFNPIGIIPASVELTKNNTSDVPFGLIFRGVVVTKGRIHFGLLFSEEAFQIESRLKNRPFFDTKGYETQRNYTVGMSFILAPRVSFGIAGELYKREKSWNKSRAGYRYGIIVKPRDNVSVGLCYMGFPNDSPDERQLLERFSDETLNVGISYQPSKVLLLSMDVRNVSDTEKPAQMEIHSGLELNPVHWVALRGGLYRKSESEEWVYSCGLGIGDDLKNQSNQYSFKKISWRVETAFVLEKYRSKMIPWFFFGILCGI